MSALATPNTPRSSGPPRLSNSVSAYLKTLEKKTRLRARYGTFVGRKWAAPVSAACVDISTDRAGAPVSYKEKALGLF